MAKSTKRVARRKQSAMIDLDTVAIGIIDDDGDDADHWHHTLVSQSLASVTPGWATICIAAAPSDIPPDRLCDAVVERIREADRAIGKDAYLWLSVESTHEDPGVRLGDPHEIMRRLPEWKMADQIICAIPRHLVPGVQLLVPGVQLMTLYLLRRGDMPIPGMDSTVWWPPNLALHQRERLPMPLAQRIIHYSHVPERNMRVLNLWDTDGGTVEQVCAALEINSWTICSEAQGWEINKRLGPLLTEVKWV